METTGLGTAASPIKVQWKDLQEDVTITGGSLKSYLEEADSSGVDTITTTPYNWSTPDDASALTTMTNGLNSLLVTFTTAVNSIYNPTGTAGQDFFTVGTSGTALGLKNVQVNATYEADYSQIKANSDGTSGNNDIAKKLGALGSQSSLYQCDGISMNMDTFYSSFISWLGTAGDTASANSSTQSGLLTQIETQRSSVSSVSLDDEMTNMLMYQHAYGASARVMSVVDNLVAGLIADLGG